MRSRRPYVASVLAATLLLASLSVGRTAREGRLRQSGPTALFVVYGTQPANAYIVPVLLIEGGQFKEPIAGDSDADEISRFTDAYYSRGKTYRVLFGGGEAGSLTIKKSNKDEECTRTSADVSLRSAAKLNRNVMALATDSAALGGAKSTRRSPTAAERAALMPLVRAAYKEKGVPASLLPALTTVNLTALDLDNDGKAELVGSFVARKLGRGAARYPLFLFAEPEGNSYRTTVLQYERFTSKDIMSGADLTAIENGVYIERLVDALDLDGDKTLEVVTVRDGLEGDGYQIYKRQGGKWAKIYEFANYRCGF